MGAIAAPIYGGPCVRPLDIRSRVSFELGLLTKKGLQDWVPSVFVAGITVEYHHPPTSEEPRHDRLE